jgi:hypothetical protein
VNLDAALVVDVDMLLLGGREELLVVKKECVMRGLAHLQLARDLRALPV